MEKLQAEEATGIKENPNGFGNMYSFGGAKLTPTEAVDLVRNQDAVEVPNAGAGSYREVFKALGYADVKTVDTTSSAGDWTFMVEDNGLWYIASQENRYPYRGFAYSVDVHGFDTFQRCLAYAEARMGIGHA
jgi:hypothetical protein